MRNKMIVFDKGMEFRLAHFRETKEKYSFNKDKFIEFIIRRLNDKDIVSELLSTIAVILKKHTPFLKEKSEFVVIGEAKYAEDYRVIEFPIIREEENPSGISLMIEIFPLREKRNEKNEDVRRFTNIYSNFHYHKPASREMINTITRCEKAGEYINKLVYKMYARLHSEFASAEKLETKRIKINNDRITRLSSLGFGADMKGMDNFSSIFEKKKTNNSKKEQDDFFAKHSIANLAYKEARKIFKQELTKKGYRLEDCEWQTMFLCAPGKAEHALFCYKWDNKKRYGTFIVWSDAVPEGIISHIQRSDINTFTFS